MYLSRFKQFNDSPLAVPHPCSPPVVALPCPATGYSLPLGGFLYRRPKGKLRLLTDFSTSFDDVWVESLETRVVLPEGATNIKPTVSAAAPVAGESMTVCFQQTQGAALSSGSLPFCVGGASSIHKAGAAEQLESSC